MMVPMKTLLIVVLLGVPLLSQPTQEEDHPIDNAFDNCMKTAFTTQAMVECGDQAGRSWEAEMKRTYEALLKTLEGEQREALIHAQAAWLAFLDAELRAIGAIHIDGTIARIDRALAAMGLYRDRATQLLSHLDPRGQLAK